MKTTKLKIISFFVLLFLGFTIIVPAYADGVDTGTGVETQEQLEDNPLNDWVNALLPVNKGEVTIGSDVKKSTKSTTDYNLSSNENQLTFNTDMYILPAWMNIKPCSKNQDGLAFFDNTNISCQKFTLEGEGMNEFSKAFFSDVIENTKNKLLDNEKVLDTQSGSTLKSVEITDLDDNLDKKLQDALSGEGEEEITKVSEESDAQNKDSSESNQTDEISAIFSGLDIGLDDVSEVIEGTGGDLASNISNFLEGGDSLELTDDVLQEDETKTSTGIIVGDISSGDKLNTSVDRILEKFLDPDEYIKPVKIIEESKEIIIEEESIKTIDSERTVELSELFPHIYINSDVNNFTQKLFGPEVKNIMYGVKIEKDTLSGISANYLAIALEKFRAQKEILEVGGNKIFGLKGLEYYNKSITELYEKFLSRNPSAVEQKILAKNISAISFSFSTYSNSTINLKTKDVFRNKLILDFQKLEKDYKNISKQNIIKNFLLRR